MQLKISLILIVVHIAGSGFCAALDKRWAKYDHVEIRGTLECDGQPVADAPLYLYDNDVIKPDTINFGYSGTDGKFHMSGKARDWFTPNIEPKLEIKITCKANEGCVRVITKDVPSEAINGEVFDFGVLDLTTKQGGEEEECPSSSEDEESEEKANDEENTEETATTDNSED